MATRRRRIIRDSRANSGDRVRTGSGSDRVLLRQRTLNAGNMWNDTDIPLAVFFTIRCYGTWLHGDERGSVDRHNNIYGTPRIPRRESWKQFNEELLKHEPALLDAHRRSSVELAIRDTCSKRHWDLHAVNIRTNHAHIVAAIGATKGGVALSAFKANATRQMRKDGCWPHGHTPWAEKGSKRNLWNVVSVSNAIDYVINRQGDDLPDFDSWCQNRER